MKLVPVYVYISPHIIPQCIPFVQQSVTVVHWCTPLHFIECNGAHLGNRQYICAYLAPLCIPATEQVFWRWYSREHCHCFFTFDCWRVFNLPGPKAFVGKCRITLAFFCVPACSRNWLWVIHFVCLFQPYALHIHSQVCASTMSSVSVLRFCRK